MGESASGSLVSSPRNPRIQRVRKLHRRSYRDREQAFLLEGPAVVGDALRSGQPLEEVLVDAGTPLASEIRDAADAAGVPTLEISKDAMRSASGTATPQGVLAVAPIPGYGVEDLPTTLSLVLVFAGVSDPGNAGTLLRSALAVAADAAIFLKGSVDPYGPKTVRASAGSILHLPIVREVGWADCRGALGERGVRMLGTAAEAPVSFYDADLSGPLAVMIGNEASGLDGEIREGLDETFSIPMARPVESLNAAAAGSVLLFEIARQERVRRGGTPRILS